MVYHINITDVDDKIILRARQEHLLKEWTAETFAAAADPTTTLVPGLTSSVLTLYWPVRPRATST